MITDIIKPIQLLKGSHTDLYETGQGCFMNIIAYLNDEPQITDQSTCVCIVVKPIAIFMNDFLNDSDRALMIPYIERAMGSFINEPIELVRRANLVVLFANKCSLIAAKSAKSAEYTAEYAESAAKYAEYTAKYTAKSAEYTAEYAESAAKYAEYTAKYTAKSATESAAKYAESAAKYAEYTAKYTAKYAEYYAEIKTASFEFLDAALPKKIINDEVVINKAKKIIEMSCA